MDLLDYTFVDSFAEMPTLLENVESSNTLARPSNLLQVVKITLRSQRSC
jgi:hypothetical protein